MDELQNKKSPEELRGNREVVLNVVQQDGLILKYVSVELRGDREVVLAAVTQNSLALQYTSYELLDDKLFLIECYRLNKNTNKYNNFIKEFNKLEKGIINNYFLLKYQHFFQ